MAQLVVRKIEETVVNKLRRRAARAGVSMEEEHRRILREALSGGPRKAKSFKEHLLSIPDAGGAALFDRKRTVSRRKTAFR